MGVIVPVFAGTTPRDQFRGPKTYLGQLRKTVTTTTKTTTDYYFELLVLLHLVLHVNLLLLLHVLLPKLGSRMSFAGAHR